MKKHPYWPDLTDDEGDALQEWFDDTCSDCLEGRCHGGGETSRQAIDAVARGEDFNHPRYGRCGCARHATSLVARPYEQAHRTSKDAALAWRVAKEAGEVEVSHD